MSRSSRSGSQEIRDSNWPLAVHLNQKKTGDGGGTGGHGTRELERGRAADRSGRGRGGGAGDYTSGLDQGSRGARDPGERGSARGDGSASGHDRGPGRRKGRGRSWSRGG